MIGRVLELAILGLLKERPMHGYDLRKRLRDELGSFSNLSFGSLYPALARLERAGAVETLTGGEMPGGPGGPGGASPEATSQLTRRATARAAAALGGRGTRARKVYDVTERGELLFEELLEATDGSDDPRGFLLRLGFARHLSPSSRLRLLERRRVQLLDRVERARRLLAGRRPHLDRYELAILEHSLELARSDLAWVEHLLADERAGTAGPPGATGAQLPATGAPRDLSTADPPEASPPPALGKGSAASVAAAQHVAGAPGTGGVGGIAGILHAGRLRRRPEGATRQPQLDRRKEQIER
jgi:DNA-binding PadR family transcriptional regulator